MAYFSKSTILTAYKILSSIDEDKRQGLTQKVSALKYGTALDMYYKQYKKNCDLKKLAAKELFSNIVGSLVSLNHNDVTKDFYTNIASKGRDYDCGSNFYSQSSVKDSRTNPSEVFLYPKRSGWCPVMDVRNQELIYRTDYISKYIPFYLNTPSQRLAYAIWILRFHQLESLHINGIKKELQNVLTDEFCTALLTEDILGLDMSYILEGNEKTEISKGDCIALFAIKDIKKLPFQQIYYGAPGTGKSHEINRLTEGEEVIRTTFHPDSDYSTFVGCYKPHMEEVDMTIVIGETLKTVKGENGLPKKEKRIVYKYSCQAFLKAYIAAWQYPNYDQYLVIEEINRGNCAQIFGDIFQLLDRNDDGFSSYPIKADAEAADELKNVFSEEWNLTSDKAKKIDDLYRKHYPDGITKSLKEGSILSLPSNLYILATMNTSDQSLFPIDSAFKRRWDWKYMKIKDEHKDWKVDIDIKSKDAEENETTKQLDWWTFLDKINKIIASMTSSADKQLGYFFCKATEKEEGKIEPTIITKETFVSKVIFYLWNDVFKDYGFEDASLFRYIDVNPETNKEEEKDLTFPDFYDETGEEVNTIRLTDFVEKVLNWQQTREEQK